MNRLVIDASLLDKLRTLTQPVELCDATGRVLGHYCPQLDPEEFDLEPQISEEEIRRRKAANEPTYTTAQVLAHLQNL